MQTQLTPHEVGIIKAGAAARFQQLNVRPETAEYILNRRIVKEAVMTGVIQPTLSKLATAVANLQRKMAEGENAGAGENTPPAPAETPAKTDKKEGIQPAPPSGTMGDIPQGKQ